MNPSDTVKIIKEKIQEVKGIAPDQLQLAYGQEILDDEHILSTYNLETISTLHLTFKPEGLCVHQLCYMYTYTVFISCM